MFLHFLTKIPCFKFIPDPTTVFATHYLLLSNKNFHCSVFGITELVVFFDRIFRLQTELKNTTAYMNLKEIPVTTLN